MRVERLLKTFRFSRGRLVDDDVHELQMPAEVSVSRNRGDVAVFGHDVVEGVADEHIE
tara:strand:+ start:5471 stop:5644 length:174 start_codon:yes stop_codon:yes gene_type:complete